jgi:large subunit ribosomal protein L29
MRANELRDLSQDELGEKLKNLREELMNLRTEKALGRLGQPHRFRLVKRDIARVMTVLSEKESKGGH